MKRFRSQCSATLAAGREPNGVATNRITGRLAPCRYCGRAVPDGSRRAAFVGGLYRTARAVPLLCGTGAVHGTPMAMECSDLSELWISLGLRASRTTGGTGRLAPCRFCGSTEPDGSRRAAFVGALYRTARAMPLAWEAARAIMGAIGRIPNPGYDPKARAPNEPNHRTARAVPLLWEHCTGRLAPCRFCIRTGTDGLRRAVFVPLMMRVRSLRGLRVAADGSREKDPGDHERDLRRDEDAEPPQHTLGEAVTVQPKAKLVRPEIAPGRHDVAADR